MNRSRSTPRRPTRIPRSSPSTTGGDGRAPPPSGTRAYMSASERPSASDDRDGHRGRRLKGQAMAFG
jgi:hypothetical protein